jgi:mRNA-degrading endonuclease toxin of MazEF toxin-antitoxin module
MDEITTRPKRGDIFRVKLYGRVGTESPGHGLERERPCLIVSSDAVNDGRARLTIVTLTSYADYRDGKRPLWGIPIQLADEQITSTLTTEADVDIDPNNNAYQDRQGRFEVTYPDGRPYRSIIDCGDLWTVYSFHPAEWPQLNPVLRDVRWDRRHGNLRNTAQLCVDAALQILFDGGVRYAESDLNLQAGHVITAKLPINRRVSEQQCLVVSSPGIDAIRERLVAYAGSRLEQCTIIPLKAGRQQQERQTDIPVTVHNMKEREIPEEYIADCREIYTINWRDTDRGVDIPPEWQVNEEDMGKVRKALRIYLDLPQ